MTPSIRRVLSDTYGYHAAIGICHSDNSVGESLRFYMNALAVESLPFRHLTYLFDSISHILFILVWQINSCISTLRTSAICANVFKSSCAWLLHHFDTVAGSLCNVFANHLLIISLSANAVLTRFKSAMLQLFVVFAAKLLLLTGNKDYIHIKLPKRVLFSQIQGI